MKNIISRYLALILLVLSISTTSNVFAQNVPSTVIAQVQAMLASKGLSEVDVKARLKAKGLDVDKMSQEEKELWSSIEQQVKEYEARPGIKSAAQQKKEAAEK